MPHWDGLSASTIAGTGVLAMLVGLAALRLIWGRRDRGAGAARIAAWSVIIAGGMALAGVWGAEQGSALALLVGSVLAYLVVAAGIQPRMSPRRLEQVVAPEPESRAGSWSRGTAKALLAIVLSGIAAMGIGLAIAVAAPMPPSDRIVIGGLLVPVLWGAGMAWTLADARLLRAAILIVGGADDVKSEASLGRGKITRSFAWVRWSVVRLSVVAEAVAFQRSLTLVKQRSDDKLVAEVALSRQRR